MSPDNLVALGIFGTAALALIAGLGAWIWEMASGRKSQPPSETVLPSTVPTHKSASASQKVETQQPPEVKTGSKLPASKLITPPPQPAAQAKESEHLAVVEKFGLVKEVVDSDPSYQEFLANVLEVEPPEVTPEVTEHSMATKLETKGKREESVKETKISHEELGRNTVKAISDPVTDKRLVLKDFFSWRDVYFSQADVDFIFSCLDYNPSKDVDHPSGRLAQCRDLIDGYPPSPIKLEVLIWMARFADQHERYTDANNLIHEVAAMLKVFLANQDLKMKERFDFGMTAQELLIDDINETQSDPTFQTDTLLSMLIALGRSDSDLVSLQKRAKRLLKYCKRISQERFKFISQDPGINENRKRLKELVEKLNSFQRTVLFSRKDNDVDKI